MHKYCGMSDQVWLEGRWDVKDLVRGYQWGPNISRESVDDKLSKLSQKGSQNCITDSRPANAKHSKATETRSSRSKVGQEHP